MDRINRFEGSDCGTFVRSSVVPGSDRWRVPAGALRPMSYGDRIFVRVVSVERGWRTIADLTLENVADMCDVYGELRHHTRGERGLTRLYVRNATRGWCFEQPFMLYGDSRRVPAVSVTRPVRQPESTHSGLRQIPKAVADLFD